MTDSLAGSCCGHTTQNAVTPNGRADLLAPKTDDVTECPVMTGSSVVKSVAEAAGLFRDYDGTRYYFCCAGCGPVFDANPAKYAAA